MALTTKQKTVLRALEKGSSTSEIAEKMDISRSAVSQHVKRLRDLGEIPPSKRAKSVKKTTAKRGRPKGSKNKRPVPVKNITVKNIHLASSSNGNATADLREQLTAYRRGIVEYADKLYEEAEQLAKAIEVLQ